MTQARAATPPSSWSDAAAAAALFAVDPPGTGGVLLRALPGPARDHWLAVLADLLPEDAPVRRIPVHVADGRLLGGLDLAATLRAGRPVAERGILAEADGGVVVLPMAERIAPATAARLAAALDAGGVVLERDGLALRIPTRFGVVALDEGLDDDAAVSDALADRLAFPLDLSSLRGAELDISTVTPDDVALARQRLATVDASDDILTALCGAALALGVTSLRVSVLALRAARAAAALAGREAIAPEDAALAARLVLAPRATRLPVTEPPETQDEDQPAEQTRPDAAPAGGQTEPDERPDEAPADAQQPLEDVVLDAARAAIPADLLARLQLGGMGRRRARTAGRAGALQQSAARGRPTGVQRGDPRGGARLNVVETLRVAAPWQRLRRQSRRETHRGTHPAPRIEVRQEDFRITRFKRRTGTTTIFAVDASGSSALHRLAEAKGAVELILADCYIRRDSVALVAFRGATAELLLPPTRSLVRAKRSLAGLPGGGGTPLAAGIDAAVALADAVRRRGETPVVVLMTDGRANIARDGTPGRARAEDEALAAARLARAAGVTAILIDTSPRPQPQAQRLAQEMNARYLPLPYADATALSAAVQASTSNE
jgi:magnesium chelatase subunit D